MPEEAEARHRHEARFAGPRRIDERLGRVEDRFDVFAVDHLGVEAEGLGPLLEGDVARRAIDARAHAVLVVDADEQDRQVPQGRHVHALVEDALLHRAVAEERDRDRVPLQPLVAEARPDHVGDAAAHDGIGAEVTESHVGDVHRTALAAAVTGLLAADLGHHPVG